ncbi:MAG: hypothetical protein WEG40_05615 [Candidatus Rokuibacteriota bacterium]
MATQARMLGFVVASTLLLGSPHDRPHAQAADVRVVTLRAVADEMYRAQPGWEAMLRRTVQKVSDIYETNFQIRLVIRDIVPWTIGPSLSIPRVLGRLREKLEYGFAQTFIDRYTLNAVRLAQPFPALPSPVPPPSLTVGAAPPLWLSA